MVQTTLLILRQLRPTKGLDSIFSSPLRIPLMDCFYSSFSSHPFSFPQLSLLNKTHQQTPLQPPLSSVSLAMVPQSGQSKRKRTEEDFGAEDQRTTICTSMDCSKGETIFPQLDAADKPLWEEHCRETHMPNATRVSIIPESHLVAAELIPHRVHFRKVQPEL